MTISNNNNIPDYDPTKEKRKNPKKGEITTEGIWVGTGELKQLINPESVWLMAELGCSDNEICDWFGIEASTLRYNFAAFMTKARAQLKMKLRRAQIKAALDGQPTMLVWLGKQILGQSDQPQTNDEDQILPWNENELPD